MVKYDLIAPEKRALWRCHYCNTNKSVKYIVHTNGAAFPVCNKCMAFYLSDGKKLKS